MQEPRKTMITYLVFQGDSTKNKPISMNQVINNYTSDLGGGTLIHLNKEETYLVPLPALSFFI